MSPLSKGLELLESAVSYALVSSGMASTRLLSCPTPCAGWDLGTLLEHLTDSMAVLHEAIITARIGPPAVPCPGPGRDPVARLRGQAVSLMGACAAAGPAERLVAIGDRELATSMVAVAGALEATVHGWDVAAACGGCRAIPAGLAAILLPVAPLLVPPAARPGLFASPVRLPGPAAPGDQLIAFLGRQPRLPAEPGPRNA